MPKRKWADLEDTSSSNPGDRKLNVQIARLEQKIEYGSQLIHRALKTARGFERQKLGRRQKTAKQKNETAQLSRIEQEIQALKGLDLGITAERQLLKHLIKTKRIAESPAFVKVSAKRPPPEGPKNAPESNVIARLFKSNPVRDVLPGIISGVREILGIVDGAPAEKPNRPEKTKPQPKRSEEVEDVPESRERHDSESDQEMEGADLEQYNARLASSSESESDEEEDNDFALPSNSGKYNPAADLSLSPTPSVASSDDIPEAKTKASKSNKTEPTTTFLPSLTMGGYWSGSESADEDAAAAAIEQPRKNRMGQQARRKLWEKKFGASANHIKKQEQSRESGWDMRRGATSRDDTRGKRGRGGRFAGGLPSRKPREERDERVERAPKRGSGRSKAPQPANDKPLHPSWEAAKKAKEQKTQAAFQGRKVVFD
ncbi:hypothetical protein AJ79_09768 [Helicocarpus griseus UAMH5409]|uniref:Bud22 domain-containing protein n=1 Tax=Helicocarpus griseus UAMH5409 TaxID=1447875 RepID=A0A2B7WHN2_9EURO|nr:hypothetical protein AJ79_09768 [Helicocarpus griseus UAMH5409]